MLAPWRGLPVFDLELDPDVLAVPSGKVTLSIGGVAVQGTVDPRGSGQFGELVYARILAGAGGWDKPIGVRHFHADNGVSSREVVQTTAVEVGETANVLSPITYPQDFVRGVGPASRVLDSFDWWVGLDGITQVGSRPISKPDPSLVLVKHDPSMQIAELACDALVLPGTTISDPRLPDGAITVRDVEQRFDASGSHVLAWCGTSPVSQLLNDLQALVVKFSGRKFLATYLYRIVRQNSDGRLQLQIGQPTDGLPDTLPIEPWTGLSGASAKYALGSMVRVSFFAGDPSRPIVDSYQPGALPLESTIDAAPSPAGEGGIVHIGASSKMVELAGGADAVALSTPIKTFLQALQTWSVAVSGALSTAGFPVVGPQGDLVTAITTAKQSTPATKTKAT
jgi:hypothetical protein